MSTLPERLTGIRQQIEDACIQAGRDPGTVKLLLATKTVPPEMIREALVYPENYLGENKVQELSQKYPALTGYPVQFHFIGHLQTNKVREVLKYASCIHSVDRISLAEALDKQLRKEGRCIDILLQVNTSYETSKFGVAPEQALSLAREIATYKTLRLKGLMTIGLFSAETEKVRTCFRLLRSLKEQISALELPGVEMEELSMGMSNDFITAIEEGATIVRIGTAVFGERLLPDSHYWNEQKKVY